MREVLRDAGSAWLVPLADLSMILFIITGTAMSSRPPEPTQPPEPQQAGGFAMGVASAVFVDAAGGPSLAEWLASVPPGPGEQVTIEGRFIAADRGQVVARTEALAEQALALGIAARVILQPAAETRVQALVAHDADPDTTARLAQGLLQQEQ
jgi:hypothetical protein